MNIVYYDYEGPTMDLSLRIIVFLLDHPSVLVLFLTATIIVTNIIFRTYKLPQNQPIKIIIFLLQQVKAYFCLLESMEFNKMYFDVLIIQIILVGISVISQFYLTYLWKLVILVIYKCLRILVCFTVSMCLLFYILLHWILHMYHYFLSLSNNWSYVSASTGGLQLGGSWWKSCEKRKSILRFWKDVRFP